MQKTRLHITKLDVSEATTGSTFHNRNTGKQVNREECSLLNMDGEPVKVDVRVTIDTEDGIPGSVFINGGYPLYETFVFRDKVLVAHDPGLLAHRD